MWEPPLSLFSWCGITNTEQIWNRSRKQEKLFVFINPPPTMRVDILRNNTLKMKENTLSRKYFTLSKQEHLFKCGKIFLLNPIVCGFKNTSFILIRLDGTAKRKKNIYIYMCVLYQLSRLSSCYLYACWNVLFCIQPFPYIRKM